MRAATAESMSVLPGDFMSTQHAETARKVSAPKNVRNSGIGHSHATGWFRLLEVGFPMCDTGSSAIKNLLRESARAT